MALTSKSVGEMLKCDHSSEAAEPYSCSCACGLFVMMYKVRGQSPCATILIKATLHYLPVVLLIMPYRVALRLLDEILKC